MYQDQLKILMAHYFLKNLLLHITKLSLIQYSSLHSFGNLLYNSLIFTDFRAKRTGFYELFVLVFPADEEGDPIEKECHLAYPKAGLLRLADAISFANG